MWSELLASVTGVWLIAAVIFDVLQGSTGAVVLGSSALIMALAGAWSTRRRDLGTWSAWLVSLLGAGLVLVAIYALLAQPRTNLLFWLVFWLALTAAVTALWRAFYRPGLRQSDAP